MVTQGWRTAATVLGLLFLAGCMALGVFTLRGTREDTELVTQLLAIMPVITLAISLVAWGQQKMAPPPLTESQLKEAKETFAGAVAQQWRQEALARSLGDPGPMPVCWELTEPAMMDHSRLIPGEVTFTGRSDQISSLAAEFRRLRRRRLVILGAPGSGKTTLAVQLLLELLATRQPEDPVPVLVSLAGGGPTRECKLHAWLAARLIENYSSLRAFGHTIAQALVERGHLIPFLDGLDELSELHQAEVIEALNQSLTDTDQLVLTSRTAEYTTAISTARALTSAAVIAPRSLTTAQAADYLTHCLPSQPDDSWRELLHRLRTGTVEHLAPVLATPLKLWLLRTVYLIPRADPTRLLLPDTTPVQADLFDRLIPAVLATRPAARDSDGTFRPRRTWHPDDVRRWLTYLAQHLHHTEDRNLRWWHLARRTLTPRAVGQVVGLMIGATFGLLAGLTFWWAVGLTGGLPGGLTYGLVFGLTFGLMSGPMARRWLTNEPAYANLQVKQRSTLLIRKLAVRLTLGLAVGMAVGIVIGLAVGLMIELRAGLTIGLTGGLTGGLVFGLMIGLIEWVGTPNRADRASRPDSTYQATRTLTFLQLSLFLLTVGLATGLLGWLVVGRLTVGLTDGLMIGLTAGLAIGLTFGLGARHAGGLVIRSGAWLTYAIAICRLAACGKLPLRLMDFLDDAYRLGLLRVVGSAYQFRHAEFQDHLAQTASTQTAGQSGIPLQTSNTARKEHPRRSRRLQSPP